MSLRISFRFSLRNSFQTGLVGFPFDFSSEFPSEFPSDDNTSSLRISLRYSFRKSFWISLFWAAWIAVERDGARSGGSVVIGLTQRLSFSTILRVAQRNTIGTSISYHILSLHKVQSVVSWMFSFSFTGQ